MEFRILGPLEVETKGRVLELGTPKELALLAVLLLDVGRPVSTDRIVEAIWDDSPPPSASKLVQTYVSHLRKVLPGVIETRGRGYVARVSPDELDATRFSLLIGNGSAAALRSALELWAPEIRSKAFHSPAWHASRSPASSSCESTRSCGGWRTTSLTAASWR